MRANQNKLHQTFVQAAMSMTDTSRLNQLLRVDLQCGCSHACHQLTSHCVIVFFRARSNLSSHSGIAPIRSGNVQRQPQVCNNTNCVTDCFVWFLMRAFCVDVEEEVNIIMLPRAM